MPNWCYTHYEINGPEEELKVLDAKFDEAAENARIETDFGRDWLGHLLTHLGYEDDDVCYKCRCRGWITDRSCDGNMQISTETAWAPQPEAIMAMIDKYAPSCDVKYIAEEPGGCIYWSNDEDYAGHYLIEIFDWEETPEALRVEPDAIKPGVLKEMLLSALGAANGTLEELLKEAASRWDSFSINQYELVELSDL